MSSLAAASASLSSLQHVHFKSSSWAGYRLRHVVTDPSPPPPPSSSLFTSTTTSTKRKADQVFGEISSLLGLPTFQADSQHGHAAARLSEARARHAAMTSSIEKLRRLHKEESHEANVQVDGLRKFRDSRLEEKAATEAEIADKERRIIDAKEEQARLEAQRDRGVDRAKALEHNDEDNDASGTAALESQVAALEAELDNLRAVLAVPPVLEVAPSPALPTTMLATGTEPYDQDDEQHPPGESAEEVQAEVERLQTKCLDMEDELEELQREAQGCVRACVRAREKREKSNG